MDRLLRVALRRFIRAGTFGSRRRAGPSFTFGDGTGPPVAIRFTTHAAERGVLLDPELKLGEAYMDGTLRRRARHDRRLLAIVLGQTPRRHAAALGAAAMAAALPLPPAAAVQSADARAAQCRAPLRSRRPALFAVPRRRPAIYLRLFRDARPVARRRPARQEAASRRQAAARAAASACSTSAAAGAGLRSISPNSAGARVTGITLSRGAARDRAASARREEPADAASSSACRTIATCTDRFDRIVSVGMFEHVGVGFYDAFFRKCARAARRRRRDAAAFDRPLGRARTSPIPGSRNTSSPAAISRRCRRCCRRSSAPACWSPTSRSCACTMPRRCKAWRERFLAHREEVERHLRRSASCGCGSSISRPPRWRSASRP